MSALTSLLVRDQVVSVRKIEEAIQRQVVAGGDLESVLLEMDAIPENAMSAYRAALYNLLPATRDEVMRVGRETIRLVPREVAEQYRMIPLHAEGRTLVVAVTAPLSAEDDQQLGFLLHYDLVYRIVTDVRVAAALSHHYGIEPAPRFKRLAERLRGREAGRVPYVAPPESTKLDRSTSNVPSKQPTSIDWDEEEGGPSTQRFPVVTAPVAPEPEAPPPSEAPSAISSAPPEIAPHRPTTPGMGRAPTAKARAEAPAAAEPAGAEPKGAIAKRLRGPLTAKNAVALLAEARERDELLEVFYAFARQFFDYSVLFVVHEDIAEGREAFGDGKTSDDVRQIAVPLDVPGAFALAKSGLVPIVVDLRRAELDAIVARDLGRAESQPALLMPVVIRKRVVLILYGDRKGERFELSDLPELIAFLPRMSEALEALIRRKKRDGYTAPDEASRDELKSTATKLGAGAIASDMARPSEADDYRSSKPPTIELPRKASRPKTSAARREDPLGVLGVPKSAPPPPSTAEHIRLKDTSPDGHAALLQAKRRTIEPAPLPLPEEASVGTEDELAEAPEPDTEVVIDYDDDEPVRGRAHPPTRPGGEEDLPAFARSQAKKPLESAYVMSEAQSDVLTHAKRKPKSGGPNRASPGEPTHVREPAPPNTQHHEPGAEPTHREPRPAPRVHQPDMPSVIVDMGDTVEHLVDDLVRSGPDDEGAAVQALLTVGEAALPAMVQRFPGPLWFDRRRPHRRLPRGRDVCAIARGFVAFRERAIPYVVSLIESSDADTRFYATLLAAELVSPDLIVPLGQRVFDTDPGTQLLAIDVLRYYGAFKKEMEELLKGIRVEARVDRKDIERRKTAIRALGGLRDARSLDLLLELLGSRERDIALEAHRALVVLTRHDFGDTPRKWAPWAEKNRDRHRVEWLIDALVDLNDDVRVAASEELKVVTQEYFGYHPSMPKRDREIAQRKYRDWWQTEGRRRFG
jgi:hypothetical protein